MQINEKLIELSKELPRGSVKVLSEKTGLRQNTIIDIFKGRSNPRLKVLQRLIPAVNEIIEEQKEFKRMLGIEE